MSWFHVYSLVHSVRSKKKNKPLLVHYSSGLVDVHTDFVSFLFYEPDHWSRCTLLNLMFIFIFSDLKKSLQEMTGYYQEVFKLLTRNSQDTHSRQQTNTQPCFELLCTFCLIRERAHTDMLMPGLYTNKPHKSLLGKVTFSGGLSPVEVHLQVTLPAEVSTLHKGVRGQQAAW